MAGNCGNCVACCKLMQVQELNKPRCVWCNYVSSDKQFCTIYEERPEGCREWECGFLSSQHSPLPLPLDMRPDISHVVISRGENSIWFHCDPGYPNAWRAANVGKLLNQLVSARHRVYVTVGKKRIIFRHNAIPRHFYDKDEELPMRKDPWDEELENA